MLLLFTIYSKIIKCDLLMSGVRNLLYKTIRKTLAQFGYTLIKSDKLLSIENCLLGIKKRGYYPKVIWDIGASNGKWTKKVIRIFPYSEYFMVDPLMENESSLELLTRNNPNVKYLLCCAGNYNGEVEISIEPDIDCSNVLEKGNNNRIVSIKKISTIIEEKNLSGPDFLKLDVQGYELEVLKGLDNHLQKCELILLEQQFFKFSPKMNLLHESVAWMAEHGFRPYEIVDYMRRPYDGAMGQCDILYINEKSKLLSSNKW